MRRPIISLLAASAFLVMQACNSPASPSGNAGTPVDSTANEAAARQAKVAYLAGINSNDIGQFLTTLTDDVVYVAPNTPVLVGKAAVGAWVRGYMDAYQTRWEKETEEFVVRGDLAYERYSYRSVDTPRAGGSAAGTGIVTDTGNGLNIYRRGSDGSWKLARDSWASAGAAN